MRPRPLEGQQTHQDTACEQVQDHGVSPWTVGFERQRVESDPTRPASDNHRRAEAEDGPGDHRGERNPQVGRSGIFALPIR